MNFNHVPLSTYRIQLRPDLKFKKIEELSSYFHSLGITHLYFSPILKAKSGSLHGYDVTDPSQINPEIGSLEEFAQLVKALKSQSLSIILDIVPNHLFIGNHENPWWNSVVEKGKNSIFSHYFDIDWHPPKHIFDNKIFLPLLDRSFGDALENQMMKVEYEKGKFVLHLRDFSLPTAPESWHLPLTPLVEEAQKLLNADHPHILELKNLIRELNYPETTLKLENLLNQEPLFKEILTKQLEVFNGIKGQPSSFDHLESFLNAQHYRLCYWHVANDEINYRRFFDIFDYASIRMENQETFQAVHSLIFLLLNKGWIQGLRIDHLDGLWEPQKYLEDLSKNFDKSSTYVVVEKILTGNEKLRSGWDVDGTVGYDFLNQVNGLFVYQPNKEKLISVYEAFVGTHENFADIKYKSKKLILNSSLASELHLLTLRLSKLAERHRYFQDFTFESLKKTLLEIIACFPIYRSYIQALSGQTSEDDQKAIHAAIARAQKLNRTIDRSIYAFIEDLMFFKFPDGVDDTFKMTAGKFIMHFQQVTGPVMAKGLEDTAFYRYFPLSSLNEVGGDPGTFGISKENFHKKNLERFANWPRSLLTTTTHDTKRSEDVRARINVLSEIPGEWGIALTTWSGLNEKYKTPMDENKVPSANEEYLLYQTLLGTWPLGEINEDYIRRIQGFMEKAIKEAKVNNSWIDPDEKYDAAVREFIANICRDPLFIESFKKFSSKIFEFGKLNSLSQLILKMTSPGIPDVYQGNEMWNFSLVDPDNRRAVDFSSFQQKLPLESHLEKYLQSTDDGRIKLLITQQLLQLRKNAAEVFNEGVYLPLEIQGANEDRVIAFARVFKERSILVLTSRFFSFPTSWKDTWIQLPLELADTQYRDVFTNRLFQKGPKLALESVFSAMPFAVLKHLA